MNSPAQTASPIDAMHSAAEALPKLLPLLAQLGQAASGSAQVSADVGRQVGLQMGQIASALQQSAAVQGQLAALVARQDKALRVLMLSVAIRDTANAAAASAVLEKLIAEARRGGDDAAADYFAGLAKLAGTITATKGSQAPATQPSAAPVAPAAPATTAIAPDISAELIQALDSGFAKVVEAVNKPRDLVFDGQGNPVGNRPASNAR